MKQKVDTPAEFAIRKRSIEAQMEEYRRKILDYAEWMDAWRKREAERRKREDAA